MGAGAGAGGGGGEGADTGAGGGGGACAAPPGTKDLAPGLKTKGFALTLIFAEAGAGAGAPDLASAASSQLSPIESTPT